MFFANPAMFVTVLSGSLRLGKVGYNSFLEDQAEKQDITLILPNPDTFIALAPEEASQKVESWVLNYVYDSKSYLPGRKYAGLLQLDANGEPALDDRNAYIPRAGQEEVLEKAFLEACQIKNDNEATAQWSPADYRNHLYTYHHEIWRDPDAPSPWGRFFRHVVDVGFDILAIQPGLLGAGNNIENVLSALVPNLASAFNAYETGAHRGRFGIELAETFVEASLSTIADNPNLVTSKPQWETLKACSNLFRKKLRPIRACKSLPMGD